MKKTILLLAISAGVLLSSCKKDRTCVCEERINGVTIKKETIISDTKKNAAKKCDEGDETTMLTDVTCYLK